MRLTRPFALLLTPLLLVGCGLLPPTSPEVLSFRAGPANLETSPAELLVSGLVPPERLLSVAEALARAPAGSLLVACWRGKEFINFWGPCSHVARKMGPGLIADQPSIGRRAGIRSTDALLTRYAVVVLDVGVRPEQLPALEAEVARLGPQLYSFSGAPGTSYCSDYQNTLQRAAGLPDVIAFDPAWNALMPVDALKMPGAKLLYVGVNENSK